MEKKKRFVFIKHETFSIKIFVSDIYDLRYEPNHLYII